MKKKTNYLALDEHSFPYESPSLHFTVALYDSVLLNASDPLSTQSTETSGDPNDL